MMHSIAVGSVLTLLVAFAQGREFTDDRGVTFTWPDDGPPPTIAANANGALALFHMGMTNQQILGVWDKWVVRGSNIDIAADDLSSYFEADPNKEELDFLFSVKNLSPTCFDNNQGCFSDFDAASLGQLNPDFTVMIHHGPLPEVTDPILETTGSYPIYIDNHYEDGDGCRNDQNFETTETNCYARSILDVIRRVEELADFLGVQRTEQVTQEEQRMCEAANEFSLLSEELHNRGVRCVAATVRLANGGSINLININRLPWLRTFEELGFPLIHPPLEQETDFSRLYTLDEWFPNCNSGGTNRCDDVTPVLPADCYLLDSRSFAVLEESFHEVLTLIPLEAIEKQQYSSLLLNDGAISYTTAANVLKEITADLVNAQALYSKSTCTPVNVTSKEHISLAYGGLEGGEYACFNETNLEQEMLTCPEGFTPSNNFGVSTNVNPNDESSVEPEEGPGSGASSICGHRAATFAFIVASLFALY